MSGKYNKYIFTRDAWSMHLHACMHVFYFIQGGTKLLKSEVSGKNSCIKGHSIYTVSS